MAADRAASNYAERDADDEVRHRLGAQRDRGAFSYIQTFAEGPGDVPDEDDGVRLVVLTPEVTHTHNDPHSSTVELAATILNQRDAGPRLNRNLLVFTAAAANRLAELRGAARLYLAWQSILDDKVALDLTQANERLAETQCAKVSQQVDALIAETFTLVLTPSQTPGTPDITWATTRAGTSGDIGVRVSKKLATEEKLISAYSGVRVKMDIDRYGLWSDRGDLLVGDLWDTYARYPHMPRLASFDVLADAVSDGTSNLNWTAETFAYADAHDGSGWVGVRTGEHVSPSRSGLLLRPDVVPVPPLGDADVDGSNGTDSRGSAAAAGTDAGVDAGGTRPPVQATADWTGPGTMTAEAAKTRFYAQFNLNSVRAIKQLGEILEHVTARLGPDLELHLEVRAANPDGYDDATQRIVSENATNLNAQAAEFE